MLSYIKYCGHGVSSHLKNSDGNTVTGRQVGKWIHFVLGSVEIPNILESRLELEVGVR